MSVAAKRREVEVFSLSFLDCICCGFGAVLLVFILTISQKQTIDKTDIEELRLKAREMEKNISLSQAEIERLAKILAAAQLELDDLNAKALVVLEGYEGPALAAAEPLGLVILRLHPVAGGPAGQFRLTGTPAPQPAPAGLPGPEATALI
eukprot:gene1702-2125_t